MKRKVHKKCQRIIRRQDNKVKYWKAIHELAEECENTDFSSLKGLTKYEIH